jgi:putative aminopeptidase FrvX
MKSPSLSVKNLRIDTERMEKHVAEELGIACVSAAVVPDKRGEG